jgi:hypothetical protein
MLKTGLDGWMDADRSFDLIYFHGRACLVSMHDLCLFVFRFSDVRERASERCSMLHLISLAGDSFDHGCSLVKKIHTQSDVSTRGSSSITNGASCDDVDNADAQTDSQKTRNVLAVHGMDRATVVL